MDAGTPVQDTFMSAKSMVESLARSHLLSWPTAASGDGLHKVALVFGREVTGLTAEEIAACRAVCNLPMGRLSESLSLSHAVAIALSAMYEHTVEGNVCKQLEANAQC